MGTRIAAGSTPIGHTKNFALSESNTAEIAFQVFAAKRLFRRKFLERESAFVEKTRYAVAGDAGSKRFAFEVQPESNERV
jgi:hypothetical protein